MSAVKKSKAPELHLAGSENFGAKAFAERDAHNLIRGEKGQIKPCEHNVRQLLAGDDHYAALHLDEFLCRHRLGDRDWTDNDEREALCALQAEHRVSGFTLSQVRNAAMALGFTRRRDSLQDFIAALPNWDNTPRIELAFCEAWGAPDTALTRAASRNLFLAMIARAVKPGAQVDTLWAFEGPQGSFKSRSLRALGGPKFHAEISAQVGTLDFLREMRGLWIAELSEMDSLRGNEASTIKRLLSAPSDRYVEKYERHALAYPRRAVAVATTNEATYWQDSTGARRLVPIRTGEIDIAVIENNREQWFAEARHRYGTGEPWWEFPAEIAVAQDDRQQVDPWEDLLRGLITTGRNVHSGTDSMNRPLYERVPWPDGWIASAEIMGEWLKLAAHQLGAHSGVRLGRIMKRMGFKPQKGGKGRERGWVKDTQGARDG